MLCSSMCTSTSLDYPNMWPSHLTLPCSSSEGETLYRGKWKTNRPRGFYLSLEERSLPPHAQATSETSVIHQIQPWQPAPRHSSLNSLAVYAVNYLSKKDGICFLEATYPISPTEEIRNLNRTGITQETSQRLIISCRLTAENKKVGRREAVIYLKMPD